MIILAIETSCDDTCISLLKVSGKEKPLFRILSNIVSSQVKIHKKWGGVYPALAKREHQKNLPLVLKRALKEAKSPKIDLIAVTIGPGLEPCLWVGVNFAKALAYFWNLPIIPINHIEAHILANWLKPIRQCQMSNTEPLTKIWLRARWKKRTKFSSPVKCQILPAICLIVSGGHTQLILMNPVRGQRNLAETQRKQTPNGVKDFGKYKILGETRDDAAGECFDKVARILGLEYPGGPAIAAQAAQWKSNIQYPISNIQLPRPMIHQKNYDFSFSGLKTAVLYKIKDSRLKIKDKKYVQAMCYEVQQAIIEVLITKTIKAAKEFKVKSIILGGGVAANDELRKQFKKKIKKELPNIQYLTPDIQFCTDNAAMVAIAAYFNSKKASRNLKKIKADANLRI